jgi:hypothetical protein
MSIAIRLYYPHDRNVYYGGEEVFGVVAIEGPLKDPEACIRIVFSGYAGTVLPQESNYDGDEKQVYFNIQQALYRGAIEIPKDESRTFPFKFVLPTQSEPNEGQPPVKYSKKKKELFAQAPHPIPPSAALSGAAPFPYSAHILYSLYVDIRGKCLGTIHRKDGAIT